VTINISGQVPAEAQNGMTGFEEEWSKDRTPEPLYAVVKIERDGFKHSDAKQERRSVMKFTHIEPLVDEESLTAARQLLEAACRERGGEIKAPQPELDIPDDDSKSGSPAPLKVVE
jgi:hypothetical protein